MFARCDYCGKEKQGVEPVVVRRAGRRKHNRDLALEGRVRQVVQRTQRREVDSPKLCPACFAEFKVGLVK